MKESVGDTLTFTMKLLIQGFYGFELNELVVL